MPLQNRVTPFGELVAVAERGLLMGNRGILHDDAPADRAVVAGAPLDRLPDDVSRPTARR